MISDDDGGIEAVVDQIETFTSARRLDHVIAERREHRGGTRTHHGLVVDDEDRAPADLARQGLSFSRPDFTSLPSWEL